MRDRAPSFPARRNSGIPHPASDPAQLYASLSANTRPWAKRDVTQFRMVSHEIEKCARWLGHACGVARDEPAAHGRASRRFAVLCISRGMRAGSAQDAGCVRDISNAGCMRAGCWPMPVQTGGQSWPRANRRLSKWVAKRLSKPWTGGGRWRRRNRGASSTALSWTAILLPAGQAMRDGGGIGFISAAESAAGSSGIDAGSRSIPHFDPAPALRHLDYTQTGLCALKAHATVEWMSAVFIVLDTPAYPGGEAFRIAGL